jgi:hypothetical protein
MAKVIDNTLYVYVNDYNLDKPNGQWSYPWCVILGDDVYPYDYLPRDGSHAAYMDPRDWRIGTKEEIIYHMDTSQKFLNIIKNAIQRRIG